MQEQVNFVQNQLETAINGQNKGETVELTESELDMVSSGGFCDWWKRNWKKVAIGAAIVVGTALVCTGVGAAAGALIGTALSSSMGVVTAAGTASIVAVGAGIDAVAGVVAGGVATTVLAVTGAL